LAETKSDRDADRWQKWICAPLRWLRRFVVEALYRDANRQYAKLVSLLLGFVTAVLLLSSNAITNAWAAIIFSVAVLLTAALFIFRPLTQRETRAFAWGYVVLIVLGFGLGALVHQYRGWGVWLWLHYRRIHDPKDLLFESLFLLGIIMGFFVVRNWAKDQKDFVASLTAVLSSAFLATILGKLAETSPLDSFAYYAVGFTISGVVNLGCAALLSANYTNRQSLASRAVLDFLYGPERALAIDALFLQNFKDDPDYAKASLLDAVNRYKHIILHEFSEKMEARRRCQQGQRFYYQLLSVECEKPSKNAQNAPDSPPHSPPDSPPHGLQQSPTGAQSNQQSEIYTVVFRSLEAIEPITELMFRVGVTVRKKDTLEYIVAPGEYKDSFPYFGSTAGLCLKAHHTIVMDRDRYRKFRTREYRDGRCPDEIEQKRGLDEIDFLSYVSIPVIARIGSPKETELGVVNVDTRIFVTTDKNMLEDDRNRIDRYKPVYKTRLHRSELTEFANRLYDQEDEGIAQLVKLTEILVPILDLYQKCQTGAT
jgi:hypothetical protein